MDLLNIQPHAVTEGTLGKNFLIYGPPSTRKTTVSSMFPKALLLATEVGYAFIPGVKAQHIESWYQFVMVINELKKPEVKAAYDTIVIDTVSLLSNQCEKYVCNKLGIENMKDASYGQAWSEYKKALSGAFNSITQMGYGVVFISHSKEERDDDGLLVNAKPDLSGSIFNVVNALVDFTIFLTKGVDSNEKPTVYALTAQDVRFVSKTRLRGLSPQFEFTFENLEHEIKSALLRQNEGSAEKIVIKDKIEKNVIEEPTLDELKESIRANVEQVQKLGLIEKASIIVSDSLKGITISEATEVHYDNLLAIDHEIKELITP